MQVTNQKGTIGTPIDVNVNRMLDEVKQPTVDDVLSLPTEVSFKVKGQKDSYLKGDRRGYGVSYTVIGMHTDESVYVTRRDGITLQATRYSGYSQDMSHMGYVGIPLNEMAAGLYIEETIVFPLHEIDTISAYMDRNIGLTDLTDLRSDVVQRAWIEQGGREERAMYGNLAGSNQQLGREDRFFTVHVTTFVPLKELRCTKRKAAYIAKCDIMVSMSANYIVNLHPASGWGTSLTALQALSASDEAVGVSVRIVDDANVGRVRYISILGKIRSVIVESSSQWKDGIYITTMTGNKLEAAVVKCHPLSDMVKYGIYATRDECLDAGRIKLESKVKVLDNTITGLKADATVKVLGIVSAVLAFAYKIFSWTRPVKS